MEAFGKKFFELRKRRGLTQKQVAEYLTQRGYAVLNINISRWEQGRGEPSLGQFFCLCDLYGVHDVLGTFWRRDALPRINAEGREIIAAVTQAVELSGLYAPKPAEHRAISVKLFDLPVSAGTGQFLDSEQYEMIEADNVPAGTDFALRVAGDSMEPRFTNGQIVWVHEQQDLENGQIGVFALNGDAYVKKLETVDGHPQLVSLNKEYAPIEVTEDDSLTVFGRVLS